MTRRFAALCGVSFTLALAVGCAGGDPARSEAEPSSERAYDEPSEDPAAPAQEAPPPADAERSPSFAEIQRELAANNQKLRELGVELPGDDGDDAGFDAAGTTTKRTSQGAGSTGTTTAVTPAPGAQPSSPKESSKGGGVDKKSTRRDKPSKSKRDEAKPKDEVADGLVDEGEGPEPAKAAPLTPNGDARGQDAAAQCQQICDLAEISCELGVAICELAGRHPEEEDYVSACERANADCDAAKDACNVCS